MNQDRFKGQWRQLKGKILEKWGKLTDHDLDIVNGKREQLSGMIQERYGLAKERVEQDLDEFLSRHDELAADASRHRA